jgi:dynein heavy chain 1
VRDLNAKLARQAKKYNFITPRDFLDFIGHFMDLSQEKRTELEEQKSHLETGVMKLKNTEKSVNDLRDKLRTYDVQLKQKTLEADKQMDLLGQSQRKVEEKSEVAAQTKIELEAKSAQISEEAAIVNDELAKAEPALEAALSNVNGVSSKDINELKSYRKPSKKIRLALESVVCLLKNSTKALDWDKDVLPYVKQDGFKN